MTANQGFQPLTPSSAGKDSAYNGVVNTLNFAMHLSARSMTEGPSSLQSPQTGDKFISGGSITYYEDDAWHSIGARAGWFAWIEDERANYYFDGGSWHRFEAQCLTHLTDVAIGAVEGGDYVVWSASAGKFVKRHISEVLAETTIDEFGNVAPDLPTGNPDVGTRILVHNNSTHTWTWVPVAAALTKILTLDDLKDTAVANAAPGSVLTYVGGTWVARAPESLVPAIPHALKDLDDVDYTTPGEAAALAYDTDGQWRPVAASTVTKWLRVHDLDDVDSLDPSDQQILVYDGANSRWRPMDVEYALTGRSLRHGAKFSKTTGQAATGWYENSQIGFAGWQLTEYDTAGFTRLNDNMTLVVPENCTRVRLNMWIKPSLRAGLDTLNGGPMLCPWWSSNEGLSWSPVEWAGGGMVGGDPNDMAHDGWWYVVVPYMEVQPWHYFRAPAGVADGSGETWFEIEAW